MPDNLIQCPECGEFFDPSDLSKVFAHLHAGPSKPEWSSSKKVGDPEEFLNDEGKTKVGLN